MKETSVGVIRRNNCTQFQQPNSMGTNIGGSESLRLTQCLLDAGIPLKCVGQLETRGESVRARCPHRRIHDGGNHNRSWKRSAHKLTVCVKPRTIEAFRAQLLPSVKEN